MNMTQLNNQSDILVAQVDTPPQADNKSDIVTRTRSALAMGLLALSINGTAIAQDKETTTSVTKETIITGVGKPNSPKTKDGREYTKLTEKEVDELSRPEKKEYYKWKEAQLDAKANTIAQLADKEWEKAIALQEANMKLETKIADINNKIMAGKLEMWTKASQSIVPLLERVDKWEKSIKIDPDLKEAIIMIAAGKLPPPGMQENAKKLIPFLA